MGGSAGIAFLLSMLAGMATAIGSLIALVAKRTDERFLSVSLGFSGGVMLLLSFVELLPESRENLMTDFGENGGLAAAALSLAGGLLFAAGIDRLVPSVESGPKTKRGRTEKSSAMVRMGIVTAIAITLHNFPEGITTFMAGYSDMRLGVPVAIAIALHNIPEGIVISVPFYFGTGSRKKAFLYSALSGLSEPIGALCAYFFLAPLISAATLGIIFGAVAGIMIYISFAELLPESLEHGHAGAACVGMLSGAGAMFLAMRIFGI